MVAVISACSILINNVESMENLASPTFVLINVNLCLHIQK